MYKFLIHGGKFVKSVGEEIIFWKGGGNMTVGKGKGKQYHLPFNIKALGKNIKWGREGKEIKI